MKKKLTAVLFAAILISLGTSGCSAGDESDINYKSVNNFLRMQIVVLKLQKWADSPQSHNQAQAIEILTELKTNLSSISTKELEDFAPEIKKEYLRVLNDADIASKKLGKNNADELIAAYLPSDIFTNK